jgi:transporter family-2 protein
MYTMLASLTGILITLMNSVNSRLAAAAGYTAAAVTVHAVGLAAVTLLTLVRREAAEPGRVPLRFYLGGFFGVGTIFACNYAFSTLSASLAVALSLLGQTGFSLLADGTGFLGRTRYPLGPGRLPGIALAAAGTAVLGWGGELRWAAVPVALAAGILPGISFILNSELGRRRGVLRSARWNYLTGLAGTAAVAALAGLPAAPSARAVLEAGPLLALGGGLSGVAVVVTMNFVFPRIPAFTATILLFSGQALAGVALDWAALGILDLRKLLGTGIVLAGLALDSRLSRKPSGAC